MGLIGGGEGLSLARWSVLGKIIMKYCFSYANFVKLDYDFIILQWEDNLWSADYGYASGILHGILFVYSCDVFGGR